MSAWSCRRPHRRDRSGFGDGAWNDLSRLHGGFGPWRRVPADGMLAGVCAGLARALNVQPLLVRLGFVAAGLASGPFAVLGYVVLAAVLPVDQPAPWSAENREQNHDESRAQRTASAEETSLSAAAELAALRARLAECDRRTAELERRVVAEHLDPGAAELDRAIRDLEKRGPPSL